MQQMQHEQRLVRTQQHMQQPPGGYYDNGMSQDHGGQPMMYGNAPPQQHALPGQPSVHGVWGDEVRNRGGEFLCPLIISLDNFSFFLHVVWYSTKSLSMCLYNAKWLAALFVCDRKKKEEWRVMMHFFNIFFVYFFRFM